MPKVRLLVLTSDTADALGAHVNGHEHIWQPILTNLVTTREIRWSGRRGGPVVYPANYHRTPRLKT